MTTPLDANLEHLSREELVAYAHEADRECERLRGALSNATALADYAKQRWVDAERGEMSVDGDGGNYVLVEPAGGNSVTGFTLNQIS